jgi:hypothetical protein
VNIRICADAIFDGVIAAPRASPIMRETRHEQAVRKRAGSGLAMMETLQKAAMQRPTAGSRESVQCRKTRIGSGR